MICRPTQKEAEDYHRHANIENADWARHRAHVGAQRRHAAKYAGRRIRRQTQDCRLESGVGGFPFVGTPDKVAQEFADIGRAGVRGIAVSFVNYLEEVPYFCAEVLPRLKRMGLRAN